MMVMATQSAGSGRRRLQPLLLILDRLLLVLCHVRTPSTLLVGPAVGILECVPDSILVSRKISELHGWFSSLHGRRRGRRRVRRSTRQGHRLGRLDAYRSGRSGRPDSQAYAEGLGVLAALSSGRHRLHSQLGAYVTHSIVSVILHSDIMSHIMTHNISLTHSLTISHRHSQHF